MNDDTIPLEDVPAYIDALRERAERAEAEADALRGERDTKQAIIQAIADDFDTEPQHIGKAIRALRAALKLATHKVLTCGVAADHPDAGLSSTGVYGGEWDSPQAQRVRKLRANYEALRARLEAQPVGVFDKRGGALWLDREQWGIVMDALIEHRDSATKRKGANEASNSDARAETCLDVIGMIGAACAAPAITPPPAAPTPSTLGADSAQGGEVPLWMRCWACEEPSLKGQLFCAAHIDEALAALARADTPALPNPQSDDSAQGGDHDEEYVERFAQTLRDADARGLMEFYPPWSALWESQREEYRSRARLVIAALSTTTPARGDEDTSP